MVCFAPKSVVHWAVHRDWANWVDWSECFPHSSDFVPCVPFVPCRRGVPLASLAQSACPCCCSRRHSESALWCIARKPHPLCALGGVRTALGQCHRPSQNTPPLPPERNMTRSTRCSTLFNGFKGQHGSNVPGIWQVYNTFQL